MSKTVTIRLTKELAIWLEGEIHPENYAPWPAQSVEEPPDDAGSEFTAIRPVDRRCMDPDQDLARRGRGFRRIEYLYYVR